MSNEKVYLCGMDVRANVVLQNGRMGKFTGVIWACYSNTDW